MLTPSATKYTTGIKIYGDRQTVENNIIESQMIGVHVSSSVQSTYEALIAENFFYACNVGVDIDSLQESTGQYGCAVLDNIFDGGQAESEDRAIKVTAGTPLLARNLCAGYTTDFTKGSAKLIENYNDASGGTKIT